MDCLTSKERQKLITRASVIGIAVNLLISAAKIAIGLAASSLAIVSEGMNNSADALSSILVLAGSKLSAKAPDARHPFGYGRIEYLSALAVSCLIIMTAAELFREAVQRIFEPSEMSLSAPMIAAVALSAAVKFALGRYTAAQGKKAGSQALAALGKESQNDSFFSFITIAAAFLYMKTGKNLDSFASILFSLALFRNGWTPLKETLSDLLGRPGKYELAQKLYREIRAVPGVLNAADLMLHNYGPESWSGSANLEFDHASSIGDIYATVHDLQLRIMHEHRVTMVFGIYAVDNASPEGIALRRLVSAFVRSEPHVTSYHALYLDAKASRLYCDFIVDYDLRDWDSLKERFARYISEHRPGTDVELTVETEFI